MGLIYSARQTLGSPLRYYLMNWKGLWFGKRRKDTTASIIVLSEHPPGIFNLFSVFHLIHTD